MTAPDPAARRRALVTRPRAQAETLAAALMRRGVEAIVEPMLEIDFRATGPLALAGVQAVLCTSANGVTALARASAERALPLFAVGEATAAAARRAGFAFVESAAGDAAALARLAAARLDPRAGRLLHVAGSAVAGDLAGALAAHGFAVDRAVLYDARPATALRAETRQALAGGEIALALFFSPRSAAIFVGLATAAGLAPACAGIAAVSISRAADAALAALDWRARSIAEAPNQKALLDAVDRALGRSALFGDMPR
ncbi:MAG TPA: uroporphyrinogen-III synthase [Stellaceae bacterium]|nr:uroporphyrinogen-III synthase [Stellaceae bacterium]